MNNQASQGNNPGLFNNQMNQIVQGLNTFSLTQGKSLTPMPKLTHAFSQPAPSTYKKYKPSVKLSQSQLESLNQDRIMRLKCDLNETPNSKYKYKLLSREIKECEKQGFSTVVKETFTKMLSLPRKVHWRVVLDLADYAKRESKFREAKLLFKLVSYLQPYAYQGWLEHAKMEEECGKQDKSRQILLAGLKFSPLNENLFIKAVKVVEKLGDYEAVRELVKGLANEPLERTWRMRVEGALFEGRVGNQAEARA